MIVLQGRGCSSTLHQFLEFLEGNLAIAVLIRLLDHVQNIVVSQFLPHSRQHLLQPLKSDALFALGVENAEGFQQIFFGCDGQHHPILDGRGYLAMRAMNSPYSMVPFPSASISLMSRLISSSEDTQAISRINAPTSCMRGSVPRARDGRRCPYRIT